MPKNHDLSHKDKQYFINGSTYNCPFCKRRNIAYTIQDSGSYNSSNTKTVYYYLVECADDECAKVSLHLSHYNLQTYGSHGCKEFAFPPKPPNFEKIVDKNGNDINELDAAFFYHDPTASFTIDSRIPSKIREPLSESLNSLKSNFLTGASGCLRKAVFKLLQHEKIMEKDEKESGFLSHEKRIDLLREKFQTIDTEIFEELKAIHSLTSQELHENDWEDFDSDKLRYLINVTQEILDEIYVEPNEKAKRRKIREELKKASKSTENILR